MRRCFAIAALLLALTGCASGGAGSPESDTTPPGERRSEFGVYAVWRFRGTGVADVEIAPETDFVVAWGEGPNAGVRVFDRDGRVVAQRDVDVRLGPHTSATECFGLGEDRHFRCLRIPSLETLWTSLRPIRNPDLFPSESSNVGGRAIVRLGVRDLGVFDARDGSEIGRIRLPIEYWRTMRVDPGSGRIVATAGPNSILLIDGANPFEPICFESPPRGVMRGGALGIAGGWAWEDAYDDAGDPMMIGTALDGSCRSVAWRFGRTVPGGFTLAASPDGRHVAVATAAQFGDRCLYTLRIFDAMNDGGLRLRRQQECTTEGRCALMVVFDDGERVALFGAEGAEGRFVRLRPATAAEEDEFRLAGPVAAPAVESRPSGDAPSGAGSGSSGTPR